MNVARVGSPTAISAQEVLESTGFLRRFSVIDVPYTALLRAVNFCAESCLQRPLFSEERMHTHKERQVTILLEQLKHKKGCDTFADTIASFLKTAIAHVAGSQMTMLPGVAATWMRSWVRVNGLFGYGFLGYGALYAKDRVNRSIKVDETLQNSSTATALSRLFCQTRTYFAQHVIGRGINYSVNLKHLVLSGLVGIDNIEKKIAAERQSAKMSSNPPFPNRVAALIESLGQILHRHDEIDNEVAKKGLDPKSDDAFLVRLEILKTHKELPPGLPDPALIKAGELAKKRDEALFEYGKQLATWFFEKHAPVGLHRGLFGWLWELEGEHQTIELTASLLTEFGLRQIVDPHRLYVAILTAVGAETMELEHDKYGKNSRDRIFKTGRDMMEQALKSDADSYSIFKIYSESGLESVPCGSKVTDQKLQAREQLKKIISGMIYDQLKSDKKTSSSHGFQIAIDSLAQEASRLPGIGMAPILVRGLVNGAIFTINHISDAKETPYAVGLIKHLTGKKHTDYLADKILELIDHPSWPVIALNVLDTMVQSFSAQQQDRKFNDEVLAQHFQHIGSFLLNNAVAPLFGREAKVVVETTTGLTAGKAFKEFKRLFSKPQNINFLETAIPFIQPTLKELELYMRVTDIFRKRGVLFQDDAKFWECYIREYLYRLVDPRIDSNGKLRSTPSYCKSRETRVNKLMALDDAALCKKLSTHVDMVPLPKVKVEETVDMDKIIPDYGNSTNAPIPVTKPQEKPPKQSSWLSGWF